MQARRDSFKRAQRERGRPNPLLVGPDSPRVGEDGTDSRPASPPDSSPLHKIFTPIGRALSWVAGEETLYGESESESRDVSYHGTDSRDVSYHGTDSRDVSYHGTDSRDVSYHGRRDSAVDVTYHGKDHGCGDGDEGAEESVRIG